MAVRCVHIGYLFCCRGELEVVRPRISLNSCLEVLASPSFVDDFYSSAINSNTTAKK